MAEAAELQQEVQAAIEQTLQSSLEAITRQLDELVAAVSAVSKHATGSSSASSVIAAIQPLVQAQTKAAGVSASLEVFSRFLSLSLQMAAIPVVAVPTAVTAPAHVAAPAAVPEAAPARPAPPPLPPAVEVEEAPAPAKAAPPAPPAPAAPPKVEFDVDSLPADKREMHKKARRFARVSVQEMIMYKPKEVELGRQKKDLYERFQEEIDKGRATYEKRFAEVAESQVDYFYEELVHNLASNDPDALGNYPYPVPSVRLS